MRKLLWLLGLCGAVTASPTDIDVTTPASSARASVKYSDEFGDTKLVAYSINWESNTTGTVRVVTPRIIGYLQRVSITQSAPRPSDNYDITIKDNLGLDILAGRGANHDTTDTTQLTTNTLINSPLAIEITNAGDSKKGTIILDYERK